MISVFIQCCFGLIFWRGGVVCFFLFWGFFYFYVISSPSFPPSVALDPLGNSVMPHIPDKSAPFLWLADSSDLAKCHVTVVYFRLLAGTSSAQVQVLLKMLRAAPGGFSLPLGGHSPSVMLNI